jgi:hypothetical protein
VCNEETGKRRDQRKQIVSPFVGKSGCVFLPKQAIVHRGVRLQDIIQPPLSWLFHWGWLFDGNSRKGSVYNVSQLTDHAFISISHSDFIT